MALVVLFLITLVPSGYVITAYKCGWCISAAPKPWWTANVLISCCKGHRFDVWYASSKRRTRQSLSPLVIHTQQFCPFSLGFVHFQLASCVYVVWAARRQSERFSMHPTLVLWGRLMEWVETAVKGKIEGGRERVRQETPNHSLSSASIHSPLHLGVQKSACGLIPLSFHRHIINFWREIPFMWP